MLLRRAPNPPPAIGFVPGRAATPARRGYSLVEVLVSMAILLAGLLAIVNFFPQGFRANADAALLAKAALLAQAKAEEVRRDWGETAPLLIAVRGLSAPTPPVVFPGETRLAYSFSQFSLIDPVQTADDPRNDHQVARVVVRYAAAFKPSQDVVYELRFAE